MKSRFKILVLAFGCFLFASSVSAQHSYISIHSGYSLSAGRQNLEFFDFNDFTGGTNSYTQEQIYMSFGRGFYFGGSFGYMFNKNIGAELDMSYLLGNRWKARTTDQGALGLEYFSANMFQFRPNIVIASGFEKINPYARFGLIVGLGSALYELDAYESGDRVQLKMKLNGGVAFGFNSGIGINYSLNESVSIFSEINMVNLSYAPTKGEAIEASVNGIDELGKLTTREKEIEFVDTYTYSSNNPPPDSRPSQELRQKLPFGSIGLRLGVSFRL